MNSFKKALMIPALASLLLVSCNQPSDNNNQMTFNIPPEYLEEAEDIPDFWLSTREEVENYIKNNVHKGKYEVLGKSAGGRPIYAVTYGTPRQGKGTTTYSGATSISDISTYRGPDSDKLVYMAFSAIHGAEFEGIVGMVNLISVLETGKDLDGRPWPGISAMLDSLDRIVLVPITNPDGRDRVPIRMEKFRGHEPDAFTVHEYLNTGGKDHGKIIGWPDCKKHIPIPFDEFEFPGGYPNDNGVNLMHDNFFGQMQPENRIICDLAEREKPDIILNLHTGVAREDYFMEVHRPCVGAYSPMLMDVWEDFFHDVHTALTLKGLKKTTDLEKEAVPKKIVAGSGAMNFSSVLSFHCGALVCTVENACHGYTGIYDDGTPVDNSPLKLMTSELTVHEAAMQYLTRHGGVPVWEKNFKNK